MKALVAALAIIACVPLISAQGDDDYASGLSCAQAGYMFPDANNLCFVWFCERAGEAPIKRPCPKGVRVPSWWEGGELNMCNVVNILKHGGEPTCLRCAANDEKPADNCADHDSPCDDECTCVDMEYTHRCDCPYEAGAMFKPDTVEFPVDHCETNPCENGATCQNQWDGFFCFCPNGYTGHRCETDICDWHPCLNGGTCVVDEVGYHCECADCWTGSCCNVTTQDCAKQCGPCKTGANCEEDINTCGCTNTACPSGICIDTDNGPQCQDCEECFTGPLCKARVDSCACTKDCPENSRCEDLIDKASHECICNDCWGGANCDVRVDSCECSPCPDGAVCTMSNGKKSCGCDSNCFTGDDCSVPVNNCECANPCKAGQCVDTAEGPVCECGDCLTGEYCEEQVNTCACNNPCSEGQQCTDGANGPQCGCSDPCATGADCSQKINSCECSNPCISGECYEVDGALACRACANCLGGEFCGEKITSCDCNSPCSEGEVCNMVDGAPVCGCPACKTGATCEDDINTCECNNPCKDQGTCQDGANGPVCVCDCVGNEECREDKETGQPKCVCPVCYQNLAGESGCNTPVTHLCVCNNPCTEDQQVCIDSEPGKQPTCKIGNPSSGNAFTVVFEENDTEKAYKNIPLELYVTPATPNSGPRSVNIRSPGLRPDHHCYFNQNLTVPENSVLRFPVERCMMHNKTGLDRVSIRLTELNNDTMLVYGINKDRWSADGFLATPDVQAGTHFQTVSYAPAHKATQFAIAALFDDTDIEIEVNGESDLPANQVVGGVYKLTMDAFETFQVQATCPYDRTKQSFCNKDLTSSVIRASRPVHVFSGNIRAFIEAGQAFSRDHLVEELVPVDRWGTYFGLMTVPNRVVGDLLNIMAVKGQTTKVDVYYQNGDNVVKQDSFTLPKDGKSYVHQEVPSGKRVVIKSDKPLSVTQWTKSKDEYLYFNETVHDPVSITVPPVQQFTNSFFISTPLFTGGKDFNLMPYNTTYAMLVAKQGDEQNIEVDGRAISEFVTPWGPMPSVSGEDQLVGAVIKLQHGTTLIQNTEGANFQCLIYGFDDRESYGFPAAMNFAVMNHSTN